MRVPLLWTHKMMMMQMRTHFYAINERFPVLGVGLVVPAAAGAAVLVGARLDNVEFIFDTSDIL